MSAEEKPTYKWPRYLLAAVILGIVISVLAVMKEANRVRSLKGSDPLYPKPGVEETRDAER